MDLAASSGLPGLDGILDGLRLGGNVVSCSGRIATQEIEGRLTRPPGLAEAT